VRASGSLVPAWVAAERPGFWHKRAVRGEPGRRAAQGPEGGPPTSAGPGGGDIQRLDDQRITGQAFEVFLGRAAEKGALQAAARERAHGDDVDVEGAGRARQPVGGAANLAMH